MKIKVTKETKRIVTLDEMEQAAKIIKFEREEDEWEAANYAELAVNAALHAYHGRCEKVMEASAEIAKNCRIRDYYHDDSRTLDVWINATARTSEGFIIIGAYLSDINDITGSNQEEIARHMYVRRFKEVKGNE